MHDTLLTERDFTTLPFLPSNSAGISWPLVTMVIQTWRTIIYFVVHTGNTKFHHLWPLIKILTFFENCICFTCSCSMMLQTICCEGYFPMIQEYSWIGDAIWTPWSVFCTLSKASEDFLLLNFPNCLKNLMLRCWLRWYISKCTSPMATEQFPSSWDRHEQIPTYFPQCCHNCFCPITLWGNDLYPSIFPNNWQKIN
jgi:hypothetical protein